MDIPATARALAFGWACCNRDIACVWTGKEMCDRCKALAASIESALRAAQADAFKAGYHCRWHKEQGLYCFDPAMSPGDPDGAYEVWLRDHASRLAAQEQP